MKKVFASIIVTATIAVFFVACSTESVVEVPITAPWDKMNLPLKEDGQVWTSNDTLLRVRHEVAWREVALKYLEALEQEGWEMTDQHKWDHGINFECEKGDQKIFVDIDEIHDTEVMIEKI